MLVKVGEGYEPVFKMDDLERFMDRDIFDAVVHFKEQTEQDAQEKIDEYKDRYEVEERIADERYQIINSAIQVVSKINTDLKEGKRINRNNLIATLDKLMNNLTNY